MLGENGTAQRGLKKRKVTEKLVAEVAPVAERPREIKKTEEPAPAVGGPEETRRPEKAEGPEEAKKPGVIESTGEPARAVEGSKQVGRPEETGITGESESAERRPEEAGGLKNQQQLCCCFGLTVGKLLF